MDTAKLRLKKIKIEELKVGMFIVNLGRSWFTHPFLRNQLEITSEKQIQKMRNYRIQEVYIDPERGMDVPSPEPDIVDSIVPVPEVPSENSPVIETPGETEEPPSPADTRDALDTPCPTSEGPGENALAAETLGETRGLSFPADTLSPTIEGGMDVFYKQLEKTESVVYWENNINKVGKNLFPIRAPITTPIVEQVAYTQEIKVARVVQEEAHSVVRNIMNDVRMGRSIESERVKRVVNNMVDSILRNRDALVSLTRIRKFDEYTFVHSLDVCIFCLSLGRHLSLSHEEMLEIGMGALLHDVGKMRISPHILKKPDMLSPTDWVEVRKHPIYSLEIMEASTGIPEQSKQLAVQHHERYDGSGYPFGLKGDTIGVFGQIAGIVDFYDSVTSDRPYQKAIQPHDGIRQIYERSHAEFNQSLVEQFIQCTGIHPFGTLVLLDTEEIGIVCGVNSETLLRPRVLIIYRNSKTPYDQPFMADLAEKSEQSQWYKRTVIMPLDPRKWNIRIEAYLSDIRKNLNGQLNI